MLSVFFTIALNNIILDRATTYAILILSAILTRAQKNKTSLLTVFEVWCLFSFDLNRFTRAF